MSVRSEEAFRPVSVRRLALRIARPPGARSDRLRARTADAIRVGCPQDAPPAPPAPLRCSTRKPAHCAAINRRSDWPWPKKPCAQKSDRSALHETIRGVERAGTTIQTGHRYPDAILTSYPNVRSQKQFAEVEFPLKGHRELLRKRDASDCGSGSQRSRTCRNLHLKSEKSGADPAAQQEWE